MGAFMLLIIQAFIFLNSLCMESGINQVFGCDAASCFASPTDNKTQQKHKFS